MHCACRPLYCPAALGLLLGLLLGLSLGVGGCNDDGDAVEDSAANSSDDGSSDSGDSGSSSSSATGGTAADESGGESGDESGGGSGGDSGEGPWDTFAERPCPDDSFVSFENFGWPHMLTFCNGCHSSMLPADMRQGAPLEVNFESIEDVRASAGRIWARAGDQHDTMPPVGPAADEERRRLGEWLACGAPTDVDLQDR